MLTRREYFVKGFKLTFSFELLPGDMKWLNTYSGELPNSACYFSSLPMSVAMISMLLL